MCGITGFVDFKKNSNIDILRSMTDAMLHRGPDDGGHEVYEASQAAIGFGQRRLSILPQILQCSTSEALRFRLA